MGSISEDEKPTGSCSIATSAAIAGHIDVSQRELALQELLKIADDNNIIIDDHLRRVILGEDGSYTPTDADESIRRSSSSASLRRRRYSKRDNFVSRSKRQLGSLMRKHVKAGEKEPIDTDSSISSAPAELCITGSHDGSGAAKEAVVSKM